MFIFIIALLCAFSGSIMAEQLTSANTQWLPWRELQSDGHLTGIDIDIIEQLSAHLQLPLVTKGCGWKRCLKYMEVGESDVMTGLYKTSEREKYMKFVEPAYRVTQGTCFYVNKNKSVEINSYQDLHELTIGVVDKVSYFERFDKDSSLDKHYATTGTNLFRLLQRQRIDALIMACAAGDVRLKRTGLNAKIKRSGYINHVPRPIYLAVSKKSPLMAREKELSQKLQRMLDQGEIKRIMSNYGIVDIYP